MIVELGASLGMSLSGRHLHGRKCFESVRNEIPPGLRDIDTSMYQKKAGESPALIDDILSSVFKSL